ncbi:MAG: sodium:solute symporter [Flavobacteriaceae bacterium]|nr:sodium:solute symporter [Flavobacteriaceae bacterium]MCY4267231.1 sodium:solute symporter [Flavobacteriaceae bacterium]MCY4299267.1 sodium:solute symporter [Flavobacteriaceae bacterium]
MVTPFLILSLVIGYFLLLIGISWITGRQDSNEVFFTASRTSNWPVVAFGMIGASLSGVTFISVPGWIGDSQLTYFQVVLGYLVGYMVVAYVLMPVYYNNKTTSIYEYLENRFGRSSHLTGAFFFFISRVLGAAFRLFLVALVLQEFVFNAWHIPFEATVIISILLIWIYTNRGGIKTIVYTDTLQTGMMLLSVGFTVFFILQYLGWSFGDFLQSNEFKLYDQIFVTDSILSRNHFLKSFIGGAFITICMTGLDQDMMQKNLTCKTLRDAQKNMTVFSVVLVLVTGLFMLLGALLYIFASETSTSVPLLDGSPNTDLLFPEIALNSSLGIIVAITFILGLIAAAYSSADSALTSLTTSFCVDFLHFNQKPKAKQKQIRKRVHILMSFLIILVVIIFRYVLDRNVIDGLLTVAGYTYGPLLGLFAFGIFTKYKIHNKLVLVVVFVSVIVTIILGQIPSTALGGYVIGYELLPLNGLITFIGLWFIKQPQRLKMKNH